MPNIKKWEDLDHWVEIDLDLCIGVGECANICPVEVYAVVDGKVQANNVSECIECGACLNICPNSAILRHWAWK